MEWNSYMRCNGLPNAADPTDLRKYLHMWRDEIAKANKVEINWMLRVNEQSFLTQDQSVMDMSIQNMKKLQPELGEIYSKRACEVLGILNELSSVIGDVYSLTPSKLEDLLDVSSEDDRINLKFQCEKSCSTTEFYPSFIYSCSSKYAQSCRSSSTT